VRFSKNESTESLKDLARRMLTAFCNSPFAELDGTILGVEEEFRAPVIPGCPDVLGRVDLVVLEHDALRIVDFKTARARWNEANIRDSTPQMLLYTELVRPLAEELGVRDVRLEWIVITKTKQPVVESHSLAPEPRQIARAKAVVRRAWEAIAGGHFYPSPSSMSCAGCPHWTACQKWEG
jgi:RecB family exonuclease